MDMTVSLVLGVFAGAMVGGAGYLKTISSTKEKFDGKKFATTVVLGLLAGAGASTGYLGEDTIIQLFSMMGMTAIGEDVIKSVYRFWSAK